MRWIILIVRAFPRRFREDFGGDLVICLCDAREALGSADRVAVTRFWAAAVSDLLRALAGEWATVARERLTTASLSTGCGTILLGGAVANVLFDALSPNLSMGIGAILLTAIATLAGGRLLAGAR